MTIQNRQLLAVADASPRLDELAREGWRVVGVTRGGFGSDGRYNALATCYFLAREIPDEAPEKRGRGRPKKAALLAAV